MHTTHNAPRATADNSTANGAHTKAKAKIAYATHRVKLWLLLWARTWTSEIGMAGSRWTDRIQARIDALGVGHE
jgi:hypothetical protein